MNIYVSKSKGSDTNEILRMKRILKIYLLIKKLI